MKSDQVAIVAAFAVLGVISTVSNVLILAVMLSNAFFNDTSNVLLSSMAVVDLLTIFSGIPVMLASKINGGSVLSACLCYVNGYITLAMFILSVLHLPAIACNRYLFVIRPILYNKVVSRKTCFLVLLLLSIYSFLLALPPVLGWGALGYERSTSWCFLDFSRSDKYLLFVNILCMPVPVAIMVFCYVTILRRYRESRRVHCVAGMTTPVRRARIKNELRLTIMLILIVIWFVFCFAWYVVGAYGEAWSLFNFSDTMKHVGLALMYLNSLGNFWIYAWMNSRFRNALKEIICCNGGTAQ